MELIENEHSQPQDVVLPVKLMPRESMGVAPKQVALP